MTARNPEDVARWCADGTALFARTLDGVGDEALARPTRLPGWTGRHLLAHVAANADALGNLVRWARTGVETPMYSSPQQRTADIEAGAERPAGELREWFARSAEELAAGFDSLSSEEWLTSVRTAQGRTVPATEVPWMRVREVLVHAVDLSVLGATPLTFADLPRDAVVALGDDIVTKRSATEGHPPLRITVTDEPDLVWVVPGDGTPAEASAPLPVVVGWLAGRADDGLPTLPAWL